MSWDAVVIHWLTFGSVEQERSLSRATQCSERPRESKVSTDVEELCHSCRANKVAPAIALIRNVPISPEESAQLRLIPSSSLTLSVDEEQGATSSEPILPVRKG